MVIETRKKPYLIAETAYNHEGSKQYLYEMIEEVAEADADAIKFHLLMQPESYMIKNHPLLEKINKWLFNQEQWNDIINYSKSKNLDVIALCDDVESVQYILQNHPDIAGIEVHATGINDYFLLNKIIEFSNYIILGIGGCSVDEIQYAVDYLRKNEKKEILLMYGFQSFPTNYNNINLSKIKKIAELLELPVGYADHTQHDDPYNEIISIMPAMMGFTILEKHFTLDEGADRIDSTAAVGKMKFKKIIQLLELTWTVHGDGNISLSKTEQAYGNVGPMKKAIVARSNIPKGKRIELSDIWFKRTEKESSLNQKELNSIIGLKTNKTIKKDEIIDYSKIIFEFKKIDPEITGLRQKEQRTDI